MRVIYIVSLFVFLLSIQVHAQGGKLSGTVIDENGQPVAGVSVRVDKASAGTQSDDNGFFLISGLPAGTYNIHFSKLGYAAHSQRMTLVDGDNEMDLVTLHPTAELLDDVTVTGKTTTQQAAEQPIRAIVVDTRAVAGQPVTLAELMNRAPGIRIRQSGGLGNAVDVSVNGFQGNSVQYFRDGIPLEYLGGGYGINNVPVNLLQRTEVYKGVIPVSLGGDALGGAINLITANHLGTYLSASYEAASFNTHIGNVTFYHADKKNEKFIGFDAFYNYADNNYQADVEVVNEQANLVPATVELFHNGYKHHFGEVYLGLKNKKWADEIRFSTAVYGIRRESQHPALMTNAYGAVTLQNKGIVPSVRYKKSVLDNRLSFDQFLSYSMVQRNRTDTVRGTYDWFGNFTPRTGNGIGESPNPSLSDIDLTNAISRSSVSYRINDTHRLDANVVFNYNRRIGNDPYGFRFNGTDIDILSREAVYQKTIAGLSWESKWFGERLTNQLSAKYFNFLSRGINAFLSNDTDLSKYTTATDDNWGLGNAVKYQINTRSFIRASAELTNRLPREEELFGNNDTRAPNFNLKPERSFNVNLGYRYEANTYSVEAGVFYRRTKGMILQVPIQSPFSQSQNLDSIRGYGFDIDLSYRLSKNIELTGNMTWQDNRMVDIGAPLYKWIEGTRLRNTPFFFANLGLTGNYSHLFRKNDALKPYIHYNFMREFYLTYIPRDKEPQGFLGIFGPSGVAINELVPDQSLISTGFNYIFPSGRIVLGAEVKNLANSKLYDYYKVQRPGRSIHFKINYYIRSIKS